MIDASAIVAILNGEAEASRFSAEIEAAKRPFTSPVALFEAAAALMRERSLSGEDAKAILREFTHAAQIEVVGIGAEIADAAIDAFARFGNGRHRAQLNMGDCFAYACARSRQAAILFKGNDFALTDAPRAI